MDNSILFEEPATEHIRFCLRLEHLQHNVRLTHMGTSALDSYNCVNTIIEILRLLDRHDLRTKLSQELLRLLKICKQLQMLQNVDLQKLQQLTEQLGALSHSIHSSKGMFAQDLRENEFIQSVYRYHTYPGGTCKHQTPGFHLWLTESADHRHQDIKRWLCSFDEIFAITSLILRITRDSGSPKRCFAEGGFFQMPLDPQSPCQMLRLKYPRDFGVFPQISIGLHGLGIRFLRADLDRRAQQTPSRVEFELSICHFLIVM